MGENQSKHSINTKSVENPQQKLTIRKEPIKNFYEVSYEVLGHGLNGNVMRIFSKKPPHKAYALKIVNNVRKSRQEIDLQYRASQACANIVKIVDVFESHARNKSSIFIVMECMDGGELFDRIHKKSDSAAFTEREVRNIMAQICAAISHLHKMNIAHRDLKPENLLYESKSGESLLKLSDFGFAKEVGLRKNLQTPCFTPYYVAPEVLGPNKYDKSCDMWSLGVIMYILFCGYPPFSSNQGAAISPGMENRIRRGDYTFPDSEWNDVSISAKQIIKALLQTDPDARMTIEELLAHDWFSYDSQSSSGKSLSTNRILVEERCHWPDLRDEFSNALSSMRGSAIAGGCVAGDDGDDEEGTNILLRPINIQNNSILKKRRERAERAERVEGRGGPPPLHPIAE